MRKTLSGVIIAIVAAAGGALLATWATPLSGQAPAAYRAPRAADGHPDLNGIWQAHQRGQLRPRGAHGAAGDGAARRARTGRSRRRRCSRSARSARCRRAWASSRAAPIPYKPEALAKKKENQDNWLERDPEIKCYLPGVPRATYMPYPFQILQSQSAIFIAYEYAGAVRNVYLKDPGPRADRLVDGTVGRASGKATRSSST